MESKDFGGAQAEPNTLTVIVSPLNGVISVTNAIAATPGNDEESDAQLRARQKLSTEAPSQYLIDSLYARLNALDNILSTRVYENDTSVTNALGLPPHSFNAIVSGASDDDIAEQVFFQKTPGVQTFGATTVVITDSQGLPRDISFDRPTLVDIYVTINTNETSGFPADGVDQIKQNIIDYAKSAILIGDDVERTRLFTPINQVPGHSVQQLFIGSAPSPTGTSDITIAFNELANFLTANIVVNVT